MAALNLAAVMDAIATTIKSQDVMDRAYPWPVATPTVPCAVVAYPTDDIEFDVTYSRGSDMAVFPIFLLVGKVVDKSSRDALSALLVGATGLKEKLDGNLGGAVQTARLKSVRVEEVTVGAITYLAAVARLEVYT